jgi:hypothetical protein
MLLDLLVYLFGFLVIMTVYFFLALKSTACYKKCCEKKKKKEKNKDELGENEVD